MTFITIASLTGVSYARMRHRRRQTSQTCSEKDGVCLCSAAQTPAGDKVVEPVGRHTHHVCLGALGQALLGGRKDRTERGTHMRRWRA